MKSCRPAYVSSAALQITLCRLFAPHAASPHPARRARVQHSSRPAATLETVPLRFRCCLGDGKVGQQDRNDGPPFALTEDIVELPNSLTGSCLLAAPSFTHCLTVPLIPSKHCLVTYRHLSHLPTPFTLSFGPLPDASLWIPRPTGLSSPLILQTSKPVQPVQETPIQSWPTPIPTRTGPPAGDHSRKHCRHELTVFLLTSAAEQLPRASQLSSTTFSTCLAISIAFQRTYSKSSFISGFSVHVIES